MTLLVNSVLWITIVCYFLVACVYVSLGKPWNGLLWTLYGATNLVLIQIMART